MIIKNTKFDNFLQKKKRSGSLLSKEKILDMV
ncbi:hypothetical protein BSDG_04756 [Parabacteroides sp. 2_1_7]|nr:hypothetical protein BSDG_04756 [Parabacteroides sp. 2_1_7]